MGFLIDHNKFVSPIKEVTELASAAQLRRLFVILLLSGYGKTFNNGKSLRNYAGMLVPNTSLVSQFSNLMLLCELQYDTIFFDSNKDLPFGGKVVVLGGDFRQVLRVIPKGSRAKIVMASINSSVLWKYCQCGTVVNDKLLVDILSDIIIRVLENPVKDIINTIYPNLVQNFFYPSFLQNKAILALTVENVEEINNYIVDLLPGEEKNYLSADSICGSDAYSDVDIDWINVEFLNQIRCSGLPNHSLKLKIGMPIILLRNIDLAGGLCNGTRLVMRDIGTNMIGVDVVSGSNVGDKVFITRMNLIPSDMVIPFKFQRRQFPVSLSFAMTINKSQGQTLSIVGLFLRRSVFCHSQLYVALFPELRIKMVLRFYFVMKD
ncbi:uncharacterized protein LOC130945484 [Arachis stenosperma]|uniref:uncharacterized protein LOC130945484 n=1 Tax=Arachis stenosperma TaxID=217475 RepID=UPI0025AC82E7|nr:uncharacterized protein LOC130945484 [Arachis stenosperma]